jgi:hypothetical protein
MASSALYYSVHLLLVRPAPRCRLERAANALTSSLRSLPNIAPSEKGSRLAPFKRGLLNIRANPPFRLWSLSSQFRSS